MELHVRGFPLDVSGLPKRRRLKPAAGAGSATCFPIGEETPYMERNHERSGAFRIGTCRRSLVAGAPERCDGVDEVGDPATLSPTQLAFPDSLTIVNTTFFISSFRSLT